jgi:hypothetical protein
MKRSSFLLILGIGISTLIALAACSETATPDFTQAIAPLEVEPEELISPVETPTEAVQIIQPTTEEIFPTPNREEMDTGSGEGGSYPPPVDQPGGYPPPDATSPTTGPAYPAPESQPGGDPPPVKVGLEATDPSTVKLASGGLQFVEFFAFW